MEKINLQSGRVFFFQVKARESVERKANFLEKRVPECRLQKNNSDANVCYELSKGFLVALLNTVSSQLVKPSCSAWSLILASDCANRLPLSSNDRGTC